MEMTQDELWRAADEKIALAKRLVQTIDKFRQIDGAQKIQRKINQELKFLEKVRMTRQSNKINFSMHKMLSIYFLIGPEKWSTKGQPCSVQQSGALRVSDWDVAAVPEYQAC